MQVLLTDLSRVSENGNEWLRMLAVMAENEISDVCAIYIYFAERAILLFVYNGFHSPLDFTVFP